MTEYPTGPHWTQSEPSRSSTRPNRTNNFCQQHCWTIFRLLKLASVNSALHLDWKMVHTCGSTIQGSWHSTPWSQRPANYRLT